MVYFPLLPVVLCSILSKPDIVEEEGRQLGNTRLGIVFGDGDLGFRQAQPETEGEKKQKRASWSWVCGYGFFIFASLPHRSQEYNVASLSQVPQILTTSEGSTLIESVVSV